jgi:transcriptional regulator with XRE-family HTH domain
MSHFWLTTRQLLTKMETDRDPRHSRQMLASPRLLRLARLYVGLSQEDVALATGVARRTLTRLENGEFTGRAPEKLQKYYESIGFVFLPQRPPLGEGFRVQIDSVADERSKLPATRKDSPLTRKQEASSLE